MCSNSMYRFGIEGYNYGQSALISSDLVGYVWGDVDPCSLIHAQVVDRGIGVISSQYASSDGFLTLRVNMTNTYNAGFSVSYWQLNPYTFGNKVQITNTTFPSCANV
eukprot:TRINITY_DN15746_c0_g1_i1.p3 TRINITY_DN15746_c0_g1~~TRINITY_DN15746_c0_g1_i1.p3  ORF type:complete len:107 (-),score=30.55 TRINITY_DN15746_c0_g1_i1:590-910(-)